MKSITKPRQGSKAPVRIALADDTGSINLVVWPDVFELLGTQTSLAPGNLVHVTGRVSKYLIVVTSHSHMSANAFWG